MDVKTARFVSTMVKTSSDKTIISFFGPPGCGKGTLAERIVSELKFEFLSTGNLCRKHVHSDTEIGVKIAGYLEQGALIPDHLITEMVTQWLAEVTREHRPVILDGYPRTKGQAAGLLEFVQTHLQGYTFRVFLITLNDEEIIKRLTCRKVCSNKDCQAIYSAGESLENCKQCNSFLIRRTDDNIQVIQDRLAAYPGYRDILLSYYRQANVAVECLDVTDMSRDQVFSTFKAML